MATRIVNGFVVKDGGILTGNDIAPSLGVSTHREWIQKMARTSRAARVMLNGKSIKFTLAGDPIPAQIQHGRWIAYCPSLVCSGCENVEPEDPIFFCFSCANADNDYHVLPVQFPSNLAKIEKAVKDRPAFKMKNWLVGESLADLEAQNVEISVGKVPKKWQDKPTKKDKKGK